MECKDHFCKLCAKSALRQKLKRPAPLANQQNFNQPNQQNFNQQNQQNFSPQDMQNPNIANQNMQNINMQNNQPTRGKISYDFGLTKLIKITPLYRVNQKEFS